MMKTFIAYGLLLLAASLEAGGDALVRLGLMNVGPFRFAYFSAGATVLFTYGLSVNLPPWDFGRLLGVYVTLFFIVAQLFNYLFFDVTPSAPVLAGGGLIVSGGLLMTLWQG